VKSVLHGLLDFLTGKQMQTTNKPGYRWHPSAMLLQTSCCLCT